MYRGGFLSKEEAKRTLDTLMLEVRTGRLAPSSALGADNTLDDLAKPWLERRKALGHKASKDDDGRWKNHVSPVLGKLSAGEVTTAVLKTFIEAKLAEGLNPQTVKHCVNLVSALYVDTELPNPVRMLPKATRRLMKPTHHPDDTPFIRTKEDVLKVFEKLSDPYRVMYAAGAWAGLRPGEVKALRVEDIDFKNGLMTISRQVVEGEVRPPKNGKPRTVPLMEPLRSILEDWVKSLDGGKDDENKAERYLFKPKRGMFVREHTLLKHIKAAMEAAELTPLTWYEATRHTYASLFVLHGGSLEHLKVLMGHSSILVTQRYAHLADRTATVPVAMFPVAVENGHRMGTATRSGRTLHAVSR
jgi:integrase